MRFSIQFPFNNLYMVDKNHWRASATHEVKREVAQLMDNFDYISVSDHVSWAMNGLLPWALTGWIVSRQ